ncbi:hypothetical protein Hanom_Chr12g01141401 [Helianthus anomalus]
MLVRIFKPQLNLVSSPLFSLTGKSWEGGQYDKDVQSRLAVAS